jgi:hypothetical protein
MNFFSRLKARTNVVYFTVLLTREVMSFKHIREDKWLGEDGT